MISIFSKSVIGLDIQPYTLRLVQLRKIKNAYLLEQALETELTPDIFAEGKIQRWDLLRTALAEVINQYSLHKRSAVTQVPINLVRMQRMKVPMGLSEALIEAEIYAQVERDFPHINESLYIDYRVKPLPKTGYTSVCFVVSRQEYIAQLIRCIKNAGLKIQMVDVDLYALKRMFKMTLPFTHSADENLAEAIVCRVHGVTSLIIFNQDEIVFYQQWDEETILRLQSSIQLFLATFTEMKLKKIYVYLPEFLNSILLSDLDIEVCFTDPFAKIKNNHHLSPDFLMACGMAMY
jgi:type IV pilus assembly protein PilM